MFEVPNIYPVYKRELTNNMYCTTAFFFARSFVSLARYFFYPFFLTSCSIWFFGLRGMDVESFCLWWSILTLTAFYSNAFGLLLGCLMPQVGVANIVGEGLTGLFGMGAGVVANISSNANLSIRFLSLISPMHYSCELLYRRVLAGHNKIITDRELEFFGYTYGEKVCYSILIGYWIVFTILGWIVLLIRGRQ